MKRQHLILFTLLFSFFTQIVFGQTNKPCNNFDCAYKKAENFLKHAAYQKALDNLDSAEGYLTDTNTKEKEQIKQLRRRLFVAIEKEKDDAKRARDEAKRQTEIAKNALVQVEIEKQTAITEKMKAEFAEAKTKMALFKADSLYSIAEMQRSKIQAVLDKIYFYDDKFGLSYDSKIGKYGFIDKEMNTKIAFIYKEASPFDYTGFAKVMKDKDSTYYLIDTIGVEYKLSHVIDHGDSTVLALDLRNRNLDESYFYNFAPIQLYKNKQVKILLLGNNKLMYYPFFPSENLFHLDLSNNLLYEFSEENIETLSGLTTLDLGANELTVLPKKINKMKALVHLDLSENKLNGLPNEVGELAKLYSLNLGSNQISKEDSMNIRKLLPNTSINFAINQSRKTPKFGKRNWNIFGPRFYFGESQKEINRKNKKKTKTN